MSDSFESSSKGAGIIIAAKGLEEVAKEWNAAPAMVEKAMRSATVKVTRWAGSELRKRVSKEIKVASSIVKGRMIINVNGPFGRVWIGLKPISLKAFRPRQTKEGVSVRSKTIPGAFIPKSMKLGFHVFKRRGKKRLKIDKLTQSIEDEAIPVIRALSGEIEERLLEEFDKALDFHLVKPNRK